MKWLLVLHVLNGNIPTYTVIGAFENREMCQDARQTLVKTAIYAYQYQPPIKKFFSFLGGGTMIPSADCLQTSGTPVQ